MGFSGLPGRQSATRSACRSPLGALSTTITIGALVTSFSIGHLLARLGVVWL